MTLIRILQPHHEPACARLYLFSDVIVKKDFKVAERRKCKHFQTHVGMSVDGFVLRFNTFYLTLSLKLITFASYAVYIMAFVKFINMVGETEAMLSLSDMIALNYEEERAILSMIKWIV